MRIAIIGSGISGLTCAHLLHPHHDVTVFESSDWVGGHTHTVQTTDAAGRSWGIDTGFIVCNRRTYPGFTTMLDRLGVRLQPTDMSFAVSCPRSGLEYNGHDLSSLFAQRRNLLSPSFHRMWIDILRFNRLTRRWLEADPALTVGQALARAGYGRGFREHYLAPMCAAIWSMPADGLDAFPARFLARFLDNHGMNTVSDRPQWYTVGCGSATYVAAMIRPFAQRIRLLTPVQRVQRWPDGSVRVTCATGVEAYDEVIIAAHADQALAMIERPDDAERALLAAFPYHGNDAVLHTDTAAMPRLRRAWAAWNVRTGDDGAPPAVTYWSNRLQNLPASSDFMVSLNQPVAPGRELGRWTYHHPRFTAAAPAAQARHGELIRRRGVSCCGAYWRFGFHEDGVQSALAVCAAFGVGL